MVNNNELINLVNNKKPVELVQELKDEYKVPSFEEFMKTYESDSNLNYDDLNGGSIDEAKRYGPMPKLYRDVALFMVNFSSEVNHWLHRGLFQYKDGSIKNSLCLTGIDEMKETLRKIENGTIKVVRRKQYDPFSYEPCGTREINVSRFSRNNSFSFPTSGSSWSFI